MNPMEKQQSVLVSEMPIHQETGNQYPTPVMSPPPPFQTSPPQQYQQGFQPQMSQPQQQPQQPQQQGMPQYAAQQPQMQQPQMAYTQQPQGVYQQQPVYAQQPPQGMQQVGAAPVYQTAVAIPSLGMGSSPVDCPSCGQRKMTAISYHAGNTTHVWAGITFCFTGCFCFVPYLMNSLKDVQHRCGNCGVLLATWHKSGAVETHMHA